MQYNDDAHRRGAQGINRLETDISSLFDDGIWKRKKAAALGDAFYIREER
jgi:hypothetical protein